MFYDFDRRPGSQRLRYEGLFSNRSSYVRIEMNPDVLDAAQFEKNALPMGFRGAPHLLTATRAGVTNKDTQRLLWPVGGDLLDVPSNVAGAGAGSGLGKEARSPQITDGAGADGGVAAKIHEMHGQGLSLIHI